ncbi:MAG: hypothetical protein ACRDPM_02075, partial [Solirubrobacteraceae bacterium]
MSSAARNGHRPASGREPATGPRTAPPRMSSTAYQAMLRRSVLGVGPYVPGASVQETRARLGRDDLVRLNWNENLFGPLPGVLDAVTAALASAWTYPEEAYETFRAAVAGWVGAEPEEVIPGHGIQALTLALVSAFIEL